VGIYSTSPVRDNIYSGLIQRFNITEFVSKVADKVSLQCRRYYLRVPTISLKSVVHSKTGNSTECDVVSVYIPEHLEIIITELLKNALKAHVERWSQSAMPPVEILIVKTETQVTFKISDQGGGASLSEQSKWGKYLISKESHKPPKQVKSSTPLASNGFGLAVATVYAQFLNGDVKIQSMEGHGTDAFVYIQVDREKLSEVIPVFTQQTNEYYRSKENIGQWITGQNQPITFSLPHF